VPQLLWIVIALVVALALLALHDITQKRHAIRRVYPLAGRLRYVLEKVGPELRQYIVTSDLEERPFDRTERSWVYQTAKGVNSAVGFGTQRDVLEPGSFHFLPSPFATLDDEAPEAPPHLVGPHRPQPFLVRQRVNMAPMSFGALSEAAVRSLSEGAALAECYINTGEGGLTEYHLSGGGDVIFQFGPAKYGVRTDGGEVDWDRLSEIGERPQVKAIEIKVGQGAKPGKGGILPAVKVTPQIAEIRGIEAGKASQSPNRFSEFSNSREMIEFVERVKATVQVPVGIKIVVGDQQLFDDLALEWARGRRGPDYISIDGSEGGTGAAPVSLTDHMGVPLHDAIVTVDDAYRRHRVRDSMTIIAAGRVVTGAQAAYAMALGADLVNVARGFLFSLGCIQALRCHTNECPTGVATQSRWRQRGLVPAHKASRVANYARALHEDLMVVTRSAGLRSPSELRREHVEVVLDIGKRAPVSDLYPYPAALTKVALDSVDEGNDWMADPLPGQHSPGQDSAGRHSSAS
jgi:glutamate synthase domain-containing protein 2